MLSSSLDKLARSRELFGCTFGVARRHKKLFLFPLLSFVCGVLLVALCAAPTIFAPSELPWTDLARWKTIGGQFVSTVTPEGVHRICPTPQGWIFFGIVYFPLTAIGIFFNVACYHQILKAFAGEAVSLRAGIAFARRRIWSIIAWSLLAGLVGFAIQLVAERLGWAQRWVVRLVGYAWSVAAVFVIPVMIREESPNPIRLLRTSAATVKKTWRETLVGYAGIQFGMVIVVVAIGLVTAMAMFGGDMAEIDTARMFVFNVVVIGGSIMMVSLLTGVLNHIYRCALYIYASEGVVPAPFSEEQMQLAWKVGGRK